MHTSIPIPSEDIRQTVEALILRLTNTLLLSRCEAVDRFDKAVDAWDPATAMAASRDMQFLDRVYEQAVTLLHLTKPGASVGAPSVDQEEGAIQ